MAGLTAVLQKLLEHLKAQEATADPWIIVYDNQGTFSRKVGDSFGRARRHDSFFLQAMIE